MMHSYHVLLKFISKEKYAEDFLNGNFYMNTLYYFWDQKPIEEAKEEREMLIKANPEENPDNIIVPIRNKLPSAQADTLEGIVGYGSHAPFNLVFGERNMLSDCMYQAVGFQYCNVLCFYRLDYKFHAPIFCHDALDDDMTEFGEYVIIVKDKLELIKRIERVVGDMKFLCGDVEYKAPIKNGEETYISNRHHILVRQEPTENVSSIQTEEGDCFTKFDKYAWQKEWRVALYRGRKDTRAFTLKVGSIRDIADCRRAEKLLPEVEQMLIAGDIKFSRGGYYGNISRPKMRKKFYRLGGKKVNVFSFIG